jgi:hypothetical protein
MGHVPASSQQTMVAAGTPRGVNAAPNPQMPAGHVPLGAEYSAAAASYAQQYMTPPPGTLSRPAGMPDPAQMAADAIRDDQARRTAAARAASVAAAAADGPAPEAPAKKRGANTGATIVLLILTALILGGAWAAYYFT